MNFSSTRPPLRENFNAGDAPASKINPKGLIEKTYQKKSQLEHILLRPDTYIGSVEPTTESMWVYSEDAESMIQREITYVPGLYKIFDEILVNAADNKQRDPKMDCIKIMINAEENVISVWNNGKGIPVVEHKDENMYVPTMIFGHLLTSSNYNDEEEKVTGGRNGYGAKLCNIFSTKFTVETASKEYKLKFKQTWTNNMSKTTAPAVKDCSADYTKITFSPDLAKFKMNSLNRDIVDLLSRRAYDIAASTRGVKVYLNDKLIPVKNFKDYVDLYTKNKECDDEPLKIMYENPNPRWEVAITSSDWGFRQVSFVNSIATTKGGRHVDYVADMIVKQMTETIKTKNKGGMQVKPFQVKNHLWIFVNCLIVNPTFDSQTKEHMTLQAKNFGSKCELSDKFLNQVKKSNIIDMILRWAKFKEKDQLEKQSGKKQGKLRGIPKLEDANDAGTKHAIDCTLILTEGDSAKTLAVSGLGVIGRDKYGVFPLRGKLLNVREASHKQILENAEINSIVKIVGLQYKKKYQTIEDLKSLRYGRIMIMTDQDQDGSHIKGLIINFIHHNWPSLLKLPFLEEFITPIIKATLGTNVLSFFSMPEFEEWKNATPNWYKYKIKYYKGLGTSTSVEAKEYFSNMARHRILFKHRSDDDDSHITMAFSKKMVDARKDWLTSWMTESKRRKEMGLGEDYLYAKDTRTVTYKDFVNKELVLFSNMDNERSIPNMVDGLKPGSRKVLFTCLKRNDKREIKVAQLAGSVAEHSAYHHGETSLMSTIVNLAQNYVGSNNINLLQPRGQFGTRLQGGKDAASARYIFTMLSPLTRLIFHPHDDPLLKYLRDDNLKVEPVWYIPVIPMVLINGADGIGTGWMTKIPNHNPREIIQNLHRMIRGEDPVPMKPWYKNFKGDIEKIGETRFVTSGEVAKVGSTQLEITELPIGTWTQHYKESVLEVMLHGGDKEINKTPPLINDYKEYNTDTTIKFQVMMAEDKLRKAEKDGLHKVFKLQTVLPVTSMCAFDKDSVLRKYDSTTQILKEFFDVRLEYYNKRRQYLIGMLEAETLKLNNQARFIVEKCDGDLKIENQKKREMISELLKRNYDSDPVRVWKMKLDREAALEEEVPVDTEDETQPQDEQEADISEDFDYLLGMKLWSLTLEKKNELLKKRDEKQSELQVLRKKAPSDLWIEDLDALLVMLDEVEQNERDEEAGLKPGKGKSAKEKSAKGKLRLARDSLPTSTAVRVAPVYDELLKKAEKADAAKEKGKRVKKEKEEVAKKKEKVPKKTKEKNFNFSDSEKSDLESEDLTRARAPTRAATKKTVSEIDLNIEDESTNDEDDNPVSTDTKIDCESGRSAPKKAFAFGSSSDLEIDDSSDTDSDVTFFEEKTKKSKSAAVAKKEVPSSSTSKKPPIKIQTAKPSKPRTKQQARKGSPVYRKIKSKEDSDVSDLLDSPEEVTKKSSKRKVVLDSSEDDFDPFFKPTKSRNDQDVGKDAGNKRANDKKRVKYFDSDDDVDD